MKKFEYKEITEKQMNNYQKGGMLDTDMKKILNELGKEGWEMIGVTNTNYSGNCYFFKRELNDKA
jgi:hypothetical protein